MGHDVIGSATACGWRIAMQLFKDASLTQQVSQNTFTSPADLGDAVFTGNESQVETAPVSLWLKNNSSNSRRSIKIKAVAYGSDNTAPTYVKLAPDNSGSPGDWVDGTSGLEVSGTLQPNGVYRFWVKAVIPNTAVRGERKFQFQISWVDLT